MAEHAVAQGPIILVHLGLGVPGAAAAREIFFKAFVAQLLLRFQFFSFSIFAAFRVDWIRLLPGRSLLRKTVYKLDCILYFARRSSVYLHSEFAGKGGHAAYAGIAQHVLYFFLYGIHIMDGVVEEIHGIRQQEIGQSG